VRPLEAVREVARELGAADVPSPRTDAELLVASVLGVSRTDLYAADDTLTEEQLRRLGSMRERRRRREPLAYILGVWGFRRLTLGVDRRVLVPRPETEVVVDRCLERLRESALPRVLDVGVGSGAIALSLADEHPGVRVVGLDPSKDALAVARDNAVRTGLESRVELVLGDLGAVEGPFDLVVSNPPYVSAEEFDSLQPEIALFEPREALIENGLRDAVARAAAGLLSPGGWLVLECADGQAGVLAGLLASLGYEDVTRSPDLSGRERVVEARRP
jgi:release factor glutamine methyltransferase